MRYKSARRRRASDVRRVDDVAPRLRRVSEARRRPCLRDRTFATRSDGRGRDGPRRSSEAPRVRRAARR